MHDAIVLHAHLVEVPVVQENIIFDPNRIPCLPVLLPRGEKGTTAFTADGP